jgi:hypothetical protein
MPPPPPRPDGSRPPGNVGPRACPPLSRDPQQVANGGDRGNVGLRQHDAEPVLQRDRELHPTEGIEVEVQRELDVEIDRLPRIALLQQIPDPGGGRIAQQNGIVVGQRPRVTPASAWA